MAELGDESMEGHRSVGSAAAELGLDVLVVVGGDEGPASGIAEGAEAGGRSSMRIHRVASVEDAVQVLLGTLRAGDAVLVKASRVAGLERVVERLVVMLPGPVTA
jgi:UDP-N-acetylmuramoyl-tripeptide--D-alanyl-D-alanine ligase